MSKMKNDKEKNNHSKEELEEIINNLQKEIRNLNVWVKRINQAKTKELADKIFKKGCHLLRKERRNRL